MLRVSQLMRMPVLVPKRGREGDPRELAPADLSTIGKIHQVVFSPKGDHVVGFLVLRPDVAGMIKREDAFVALDSCVANDVGLVVARDEGMDDAARKRLSLDWDACIMWAGMDARTTDGKELGWVGDVEFHPRSGKVSAFHVGDGSVAQSLVGNVVVPVDMLRGYRDGYLVVDAQAAKLKPDGGLAAKAGEGYAKAKNEGKQAAAKVGKAAGVAAEKGARGLGSALGRTKGMFGSFMDEYKKASK